MRGETGHFLKRTRDKKTLFSGVCHETPRREYGPIQHLRDVMVVLING